MDDAAEKGDLVAYAGRAIDGTEPRYKFPVGFRKSLELFNLNRVRGELSVVLVEGFFDCLTVSAAGFPCVALMGSSMSAAQEELIVRHFNVACVLLDGDEAGREGAMDCLTRLGRRMWTYAPTLPEGKQPDMLTDEASQVPSRSDVAPPLPGLVVQDCICCGDEPSSSSVRRSSVPL